MLPTGSFSRKPTSLGVCRWQKWLRAQRAGRLAPQRGGAKRRAAALGAAQRREAPPQAVERRASRKCRKLPYFEAEAVFGDQITRPAPQILTLSPEIA
eukprot:scaffold94660_cov68-Phaeocystis_antarctica.AAC.4